MKKISIVLASFFTICIVGVVAFNSAKTPSKNKEGIVELTGPVSQDSAARKSEQNITTMGFQLAGDGEDNEK